MLRVEKYKNIQKLEKIWIEMQGENSNLDAMAEYEFVKMFRSGISNKIKALIKPSKGGDSFYCVFDNDTPILILAAAVKDDCIESVYTLDFFDVVTTKEIDERLVYDALLEISKTEQKPIVLRNLKEGKNTHSKLEKFVKFEDDSDCVKIEYTRDYDAYYSSLSKHARQNLRTAYNRLKTDGLEYRFEFIDGKTDKKLASKLKNLYLNRRAKKYSNMDFLKMLIYKIDEPISKVCFNLENSFSAVLYIDNQIACYMAGVIKNGEVLVPRLAIDDKFSRYSVGVILVNETIKTLIDKNIFTLDLATGAEVYKTQMGGTLYHTLKCKIDSNKNP